MDNVGLYRSYAALLVGAVVPIYCGAHASIQVPKSVKHKWREISGKKLTKEEQHEEDEEDDVERLTAEDAYIFPILGSCVLFGLFLAFKYLDKALLNKILGGYVALMGIGALGRTMGDVLKLALGAKRNAQLAKYSLSLKKKHDGKSADQFRVTFTRLHVFSALSAVALALAQQYTQYWVLSNVLALSAAYTAIGLFYVDSFATGSILLAGLFLYDIWWVFGSKAAFGEGADVMVSVAKNFDAPIKIVFPKDLANAKDFTLLGLGDIVLPGSFLALALRFDYHQAIKRALSRSSSPPRPSERFAKPYFFSCFAAYIAGLALTIFVMHFFRAAQPALLYLSPACTGSVTLLALLRGESKELWGWEDGKEEREERERKEKAQKENEERRNDDVEEDKDSTGAGVESAGSTVETRSIDIGGGRVLRSRAVAKK
ncbi:hypothetical protein JCM10212_003577 [Sporobolomyces blumeae]